MKKEPIEQRLEELPWQEPSAGLEERIFGKPEAAPALIAKPVFGGKIQLGWAAALVAVAGLVGYQLMGDRGQTAVQPTAGPASTETDVQIIATGTIQNFFDFTSKSQDPWPGPIRFGETAMTD